MARTGAAERLEPVVLAEMTQAEAAEKLREVGEEEAAALLEKGQEPEGEPLEPAVRGFAPGTSRRADRIREHSFGYLPTGGPTGEVLPVTFAGSIAGDASLKGARVKITLARMYIENYPGRGEREVLFEFSARNQLDKAEEKVHFNAKFRAQEGQYVAQLNIPIFVGLNVGEQGLEFACNTVNVQNRHDEKFLSFLESDVFTGGLKLLTTAQPAIAPLSALAVGLAKGIANRNKNVGVQSFRMGLDFGTAHGGARLAEGTYFAVQAQGLDWNRWVYDPARGDLMSTNKPVHRLPRNYIAFNVERM